jgi:hypothetical protein
MQVYFDYFGYAPIIKIKVKQLLSTKKTQTTILATLKLSNA